MMQANYVATDIASSLAACKLASIAYAPQPHTQAYVLSERRNKSGRKKKKFNFTSLNKVRSLSASVLK